MRFIDKLKQSLENAAPQQLGAKLTTAPKHVLLADVRSALAEQQMQLNITRKKVKNINFRVKENVLMVSAPTYVSNPELARVIFSRLDWAVSANQKLRQKQRIQPQFDKRLFTNGTVVKLWGQDYQLKLHCNHQSTFFEADTSLKHIHVYVRLSAEDANLQAVIKGQLLAWYRAALSEKMPILFAKWQPIVGKNAAETRIKKMTTRWGSCNVRAKRVWLSLYLAQYPVTCTEYVIVHELCHLYEANHSKKFWAHVQTAMPNYQQWHQYLKGTGTAVD